MDETHRDLGLLCPRLFKLRVHLVDTENRKSQQKKPLTREATVFPRSKTAFLTEDRHEFADA
jgi:hypothetical protein